MAIVGSDVTVDVHTTENVDIDSVRGAVRSGDRVDPALADAIRQAIDRTVRRVLDEKGIKGASLDLEVRLVDDRVPGVPRERVLVRLDVEGDDEVLAAVDENLSPPERARLANAVEETVLNYLDDHDLRRPTQTIVRVTPVQFR